MIEASMAVIFVGETEEAGVVLEMSTRGRTATFVEVLTNIVEVLCPASGGATTKGLLILLFERSELRTLWFDMRSTTMETFD